MRPRRKVDTSKMSPEQIQKMEERAAAREAKRKENWSPLNYLVWLLGRREYSRAELLQKLKMKEVPQDEAEKLVDRIQELGLQSDERFLASKVRMQKNQGKGPAYIRAHLRQHNLPDAEVSQALDPQENDWLASAYDLAERKFGQGPYARDVGTKVFNLLLRRGFSFDQAKKVVNIPREEAFDE